MKIQETRNNHQTNHNTQYLIDKKLDYSRIVIWNLFVSCILYLGYFRRERRGMFLPAILMAMVLFIAFATALIMLATSNIKVAELHNKKITSMSIAEAGMNYYLWHLSHNNTDYCDGQTCSGQAPYGPFVHNYTDQSDGETVGTYSLYVTPPTQNSSNVIVKSVGKVNGKSPTETIVSTIGMPSFSKYSLLVNNSEIWVGSGERIDGSVFVNHSGIKNDGQITGNATSTESTYYSQMFRQTFAGINGSGTFGGTKTFPATPIDFNQLDVDIKTLRDTTEAQGQSYYDNSGKSGYHIVLKASNYELRRVTKFDSDGYNITQENSLGTYSYPTAGIIFCEDNVWVDGTINNQKVTIVAGDPEANSAQRKRIIIPGNIKYSKYDGTDKIGLITQTNILVTRNAPDDLEIDAAMIAKDGEIRIDSYCPKNVSQYCMHNTATFEHKHHIKVYGSMAHNTGLIWTYDFGNSHWTGYETTELIIDQQNVLNPPPQFPLTGSYVILSWREE